MKNVISRRNDNFIFIPIKRKCFDKSFYYILTKETNYDLHLQVIQYGYSKNIELSTHY